MGFGMSALSFATRILLLTLAPLGCQVKDSYRIHLLLGIAMDNEDLQQAT
jgi:hypothetical protein